MPSVSEKACPAEVIEAPTRDGHKATAVIRKPPGEGPFPAVVLLLAEAALGAEAGFALRVEYGSLDVEVGTL